MESFVIEIMNSYGYIGICLLIMLENLFPPIPSEVILTFGGFMTMSSDISIGGVIIASTVGSLLGACILYWIGKVLNKDRLIKIVKSKYGKLLRVKPKDIQKADNWFDTKGNITVFFCRFIPVVRSLISIPAGMSDMSFVRFIIYTVLGSVIWNTVLIYVGVFAWDKKDLIFNIIDKISYMVLFLIIIGLFILGVKFYNKRSKRNNKNSY